jgi:hypothetical protein
MILVDGVIVDRVAVSVAVSSSIMKRTKRRVVITVTQLVTHRRVVWRTLVFQVSDALRDSPVSDGGRRLVSSRG